MATNTLYTSDDCGACKTVKYMLDKLGIDYEVKNVSNKSYEAEMLKLTGVTTTPVFVKGEHTVIGGNLVAIKKLVS